MPLPLERVHHSRSSQVKWVREMIDPKPKLVKRSLDMFAVPLGHNEATEFGVATYGLGQWSYTYRGHQVYGYVAMHFIRALAASLT